MLAAGDRVAVSVPASSANLGPGFDAVGLGLGLREEYAVHVTSAPGLVVTLAGEGAEELATDETHLVARALRTALEVCGVDWLDGLRERGLGLELECRNAIPMSAGLGSSAAALVGGLALGFALVRGGSLTDDDLTLVNTHAGIAEGHPDNSSASVYGGMTVSWMPSPTTVRTAHLTVHEGIEPLVLLPASTRLSTSTARGVLPPVVSRSDAIEQAAKAALLTHAMTTDPTLLLDATQDRLHQEQRRGVYPESMGVVDELRSLGHAAVISGAGPAVLVLARRAVADAVVAEVRSWGRTWRVLRPGVAAEGVRVEG
ncbi:homoserine kinase [Ornithinimicrobium sp. F0845]|uniref:homoserine kinase n=1 Tax=Ornithinimicrobium sp. F0845 TaxID=2926412 RepID=UPI001FF59805|nr:homoserine kinase [Ornithinimicrobium sp. F0845]MCK0114041.1 homoserine kinase [Ornithinimicrobium sp. F0845]